MVTARVMLRVRQGVMLMAEQVVIMLTQHKSKGLLHRSQCIMHQIEIVEQCLICLPSHSPVLQTILVRLDLSIGAEDLN